MSKIVKQYSIKISELYFYVFFVSLLFAKGIGLYDGQAVFKIFLLIALGSWGLKQLFTEYTWREAVLCTFLVIIGAIIYLNSHEKGVLFCVLLVSGMKGMNVKKVFQVGLVTWILSFGSLFLLTSFHLIDSHFKVHDKLGLGRIIRWSLGYAHPNVLHISYLVLACFIIYLVHDKVKFKVLVVLMLLNIYVFMYSLSSTGFIAVSILLTFAIYWGLRKNFCRAEQILIQLCLPVCITFSMVAPIVLDGQAFEIVNKLMNTRLALSRWFLVNQPVQLWGTDTTKLVTSLRTMDNSYVFAWITYGLIFFVIMIAAYFALVFQKVHERDGIALSLILTCLIAGVTEPFLFNTSFKNITLIFIGNFLFENRLMQNENKVPLLGKYDKEILICGPDLKLILKSIKEAVTGHEVRLTLISVFAGILVSSICFLSTKMPERYIIPRTAFEETGDIEEAYHLSTKDDLPRPGDLVLGYVDADTEMIPFAGNIAVVERFRNTVCGMVATAFFVYILGSIYLWTKVSIKQSNVSKNKG